ncbi:GntR family transcriptional regulator [Actinomyces sp. AC-19-1]|nr:GntR family transcriptional regulator [Actinomyces sp. 217892]
MLAARALGVAVNTVAKAYRTLEEEGVVEGRGRLGTFVVEPGAGQREALRFARAMKDAGLTLTQAQALLRAAWGPAGPR